MKIQFFIDKKDKHIFYRGKKSYSLAIINPVGIPTKSRIYSFSENHNYIWAKVKK